MRRGGKFEQREEAKEPIRETPCKHQHQPVIRLSGADLVSVGLIKDGPAEDHHVEDDYEAVKYGEEGHLQNSMMMRMMIKYIQKAKKLAESI